MRFETLEQLADICLKENKTIAEVMLEDQAKETAFPPKTYSGRWPNTTR
ncbi:hypothetical protein CM49_05563 [Paenibacillus sp. P1XP2]|nr:hypothetical protein CM49_05563 [Paenibacillus sp. P1XP2]